MFVLGNVLVGLGQVLYFGLQVYFWVLIGRAIISWVNADPRNPIVQFLVRATDPPLRVIRKLLPMSLRYFPLDIAFLVLMGLVLFLQYAVAASLVEAGRRLGATSVFS
jgi:YggT family protein